MNRNIVVHTLPAFSGREIAMSDIHGNFSLYLAMLEKVNYTPGKDRLILAGDLVEKGPENLRLLRHVMAQKAAGEQIYCLMGNCDFTAKNILYAYRLDFIKDVLLQRKASLIHEMAASAGIAPLDPDTDMSEYTQAIRRHFLPELCFLNDLPHILIGEKRIYTHAGFVSEEDFGSDMRFAMTMPFFMERSLPCKKTVVCGHLPVTEYCKDIACFNVRYDAWRNIYGIDGGNMVKTGGQLNAIVFENERVTTLALDDLEEVTALVDTHPRNFAPVYLTWNRSQLELVRKGEIQSLVHCSSLHRTFWMDNAFLHPDAKGLKGFDYTSYEMPLKKGRIYKLVSQYGDKVQLKDDGILGWTYAANIQKNA